MERNHRVAFPAAAILQTWFGLFASVDNYFRAAGCHWLKGRGPSYQVPRGILSGPPDRPLFLAELAIC